MFFATMGIFKIFGYSLDTTDPLVTRSVIVIRRKLFIGVFLSFSGHRSSLQLAFATWRLNSRTTAHSAPRTKASHLKTRSTHLGLPRRAAWCRALKPLLLVRVMSAAWSNNRANMSSRFLEIASWRGVSPSESCEQKTYFSLCYIYPVFF